MESKVAGMVGVYIARVPKATAAGRRLFRYQNQTNASLFSAPSFKRVQVSETPPALQQYELADLQDESWRRTFPRELDPAVHLKPLKAAFASNMELFGTMYPLYFHPHTVK